MSKAERESDRENILERKKRQRTEAYSRRRSLTEEERAAKSAAICHFLQEIPALQQAETVFSYAASAVEANLDEINQVLAEQGKRVCFPLCYSDGIMQAVLPAIEKETGAGIRQVLCSHQPAPREGAELREYLDYMNDDRLAAAPSVDMNSPIRTCQAACPDRGWVLIFDAEK